MVQLIIAPHIIPYFPIYMGKKVNYFSSVFWEEFLDSLNFRQERNPIIINSEGDLNNKNIFYDLLEKAKMPGQNWWFILEDNKQLNENVREIENNIKNYNNLKEDKYFFPAFVSLAIWAYSAYSNALNSKQLLKIAEKQNKMLADLKGEKFAFTEEDAYIINYENELDLASAKKIWSYWFENNYKYLTEIDEYLILKEDFYFVLKEGLIEGKIIAENNDSFIFKFKDKKLNFSLMKK